MYRITVDRENSSNTLHLPISKEEGDGLVQACNKLARAKQWSDTEVRGELVPDQVPSAREIIEMFRQPVTVCRR